MYYLLSLATISLLSLCSWYVHFQLKKVNLNVETIITEKNNEIEMTNEIKRKTSPILNRLRVNVINDIPAQFHAEDLTTRINKSFRHGLQIDINEENYGKKPTLSFSYQEITFPPKIEDENRADRSFDKYVIVHAQYTEQLSMGTLSLLSLCGQAQYGGRKVVRPFVSNSIYVSKKKKNVRSLGILFDLKHLDNLLDHAGYSPMVDKQDYQVECKPTNPNHVTIHFLYIGEEAKKWNSENLKISEETYDSILEKTKTKGWTDCSFLDKNLGLAPSKKQFCINPTIIADWKVLERDVVNGTKCLNIYLWRGIGGGMFRSHFTDNHFKFPHNTIQYAIKPSQPIQNEVNRFRRKFLPDRFIAVYLRAEFILIPHKYDINFLKNCINVIAEVIDVLKERSGLSRVYLASDMSKYGSDTLQKYVSDAKLDRNPFPGMFTSLMSRVGGVVYNYNPSTSEISDRGAIALVDLTLLSQAQYLITAGRESGSSFVRWVTGTFLANHREDKELWSKISVCGK